VKWPWTQTKIVLAPPTPKPRDLEEAERLKRELEARLRNVELMTRVLRRRP